MIDVERWVLAEAWIVNGLRIRWSRSYEEPPRLFGDDRYYWYDGNGEWAVLDPDRHSVRLFGKTTAPEMNTDDMRHELAHWLSATEEQRRQVNFGTTTDDEVEQKAIDAERVIASIVTAASRIATMALRPPEKKT